MSTKLKMESQFISLKEKAHHKPQLHQLPLQLQEPHRLLPQLLTNQPISGVDLVVWEVSGVWEEWVEWEEWADLEEWEAWEAWEASLIWHLEED